MTRLSFLALLLMMGPAIAAEPVLPYGFTCEQVRSFVNVHGRWKALAWAVEQGATVGQIAAARRCLAGGQAGDKMVRIPSKLQ